MKKILLSFFTLFLTSLGYSQTGSIAIVSIPTPIEAGTTANLQFTYTSDVDISFTVSLFKTVAGSLTVDYNGTWQGAVTVSNLIAGTNVPVNVSFPVPGNTNPTSNLPTGVQYTFDLKLTSTSGATDFGYSNGTSAHITEITASTVPVDNINFTAATVASVNPGDNLSVSFDYTLSVARNVKAGLAIYDGSGTWVANASVGGTEVAQYYSNQPATTTTPVSQTASISIPAGITPSSQLPTGQVYKVVITIATTSDSWIFDRKNDITVADLATGLYNNTVNSKLSIFPNPTTDVVNVSYPGTIESINLYNASGSIIDIGAPILNSGEIKINTSALKNGVYMLKISTNEGVASVKLVK